MKKRFALMGNPVAHSLSPLIHQRFAEQRGIQLSYEKILVDNESLFAEKVADFFSQGGQGLNITLPYKQNAFALAAINKPHSKAAKAANTLWMSEGKLCADNTDGIGLIRDLSTHCELAGKQVLLLGAGGAARGIITPLLAAGISQLQVTNRTIEKAKQLQKDFSQIKCCALSELTTAFDLIINATSASLKADKLTLPKAILKPTSLCYDLSYSLTGKTPFVEWATEQGVQAVDGLGMLVEQAAESFFIWHGLRPDAQAVLREIDDLKK